MKRTIATAVMLAAATAASADLSNPLETRDEARQRESAENYRTYQERENRMLPPSYNRPLGDTQRPGVDRPGYNQDPYQYRQFGR